MNLHIPPQPVGCLGGHQSLMCKWTRPFWGTDCRRSPKNLSRPGLLSLQCRHWESSKVLAGLPFCEMLSHYPQSTFQGVLWGLPGGQQQSATQTLRVHLLGLESSLIAPQEWGSHSCALCLGKCPVRRPLKTTFDMTTLIFSSGGCPSYPLNSLKGCLGTLFFAANDRRPFQRNCHYSRPDNYYITWIFLFRD